jgi:nucleotide-binding universal stress UspA family protein
MTRVQTIAFATALEPDEGPALVSATALATASNARLVTVYASQGTITRELPHPERLAEAWARTLQHEEMAHTCCDDATNTLLDALKRVKPELVVVGTHRRSALSQLFNGSVGESVARNTSVPTLFVPLDGPGLARAATGQIEIDHILVPAGDAESVRAALHYVAWFTETLGLPDVDVVLIHVGEGAMPGLDAIPEGMRVRRRMVEGSLEDALAGENTHFTHCMFVMATRGHDGIGDTLLGSHTERVIRRITCPLLSVPILSA